MFSAEATFLISGKINDKDGAATLEINSVPFLTQHFPTRCFGRADPSLGQPDHRMTLCFFPRRYVKDCLSVADINNLVNGLQATVATVARPIFQSLR